MSDPLCLTTPCLVQWEHKYKDHCQSLAPVPQCLIEHGDRVWRKIERVAYYFLGKRDA